MKEAFCLFMALLFLPGCTAVFQIGGSAVGSIFSKEAADQFPKIPKPKGDFGGGDIEIRFHADVGNDRIHRISEAVGIKIVSYDPESRTYYAKIAAARSVEEAIRVLEGKKFSREIEVVKKFTTPEPPSTPIRTE